MGVIVRQKTKDRGKPWWVFVSHNGQRVSKKIGAKDAAEEVAKAVQARIALGEPAFEEKEDTQTFKEYAESFMAGYSVMNHKASTHESYQSVLDLHLLPAFGKMPLDTITRKDVKDFITAKNGDKLSPASIRNLKAYLSCILSQAMDDEIIPANPAAMTGKLIKSKEGKNEIGPLTWEEKATFEEAMKKHFPRYYPLYLTALRTGARMGELLALQAGDLDFNGNFIEIRRNYVRGNVTTTKTGMSRRVDMSDGLAKVLEAYLTERKKEALEKGWGKPPEWLFYNEAGKPLNVSNLMNRIFVKCLEKAKLSHRRQHDLRHTYATLRIAKGDNILDVSRQLGHHSVKLTLDVYAHWLPGEKKSEVDELDSASAPIRTLYAPKPAIEQKKDLPN